MKDESFRIIIWSEDNWESNGNDRECRALEEITLRLALPFTISVFLLKIIFPGKRIVGAFRNIRTTVFINRHRRRQHVASDFPFKCVDRELCLIRREADVVIDDIPVLLA